MIYEIIRNDNLGALVFLKFGGLIPLEVREAVKAAGFWFDFSSGMWRNLDRPDDEIRKMLSDAEKTVKARPAPTKANEAALKAEYMEKIMDGEDEHWRKYYEGRIGVLVRLTDGRIVNLEKPRIETSFCFGEHGFDADEKSHMAYVAKNNEDYFRRENLRGLKKYIDVLGYRESEYYNPAVTVCCPYRDKPSIASMSIGSAWDRYGNPVEEVSEEDRERLLEGYIRLFDAFEKRVNAYLKRYGLSKVRSWTYWADA